MHILNVATKRRTEFIDITGEVKAVAEAAHVVSGLCIVFCPHTTAGLTINENADPAVRKDIIQHLEKLAPADKNYCHCEGNSDAHIKSSLLGSSVNVIIDNGQLALGTWQGIYFCEFDGPRQRQVYVQLISA